MKCVMLSIRPKYCELIASGKKTVEVRRTKPKIDVPFKCYIYCTQNTPYNPVIPMKYEKEGGNIYIGGKRYAEFLTGKVIGEFVCDRIDTVASIRITCMDYITVNDKWETNFGEISCLSVGELGKYLGYNKHGYAWHITDLVIYEQPKALSEFRSYNVSTYIDEEFGLPMPTHIIKRPPQSWCYVEELEGESE